MTVRAPTFMVRRPPSSKQGAPSFGLLSTQKHAILSAPHASYRMARAGTGASIKAPASATLAESVRRERREGLLTSIDHDDRSLAGLQRDAATLVETGLAFVWLIVDAQARVAERSASLVIVCPRGAQGQYECSRQGATQQERP